MVVPANKVQAQGQGAVTADQTNTFGQTCNNLAQLRDFVGIGGMWLLLKGYAAVNDGGQAFYYWDSNSTGPDNGTTIIQPTGQTFGAWIRIGRLLPQYTGVILTWTGAQTTANEFLGGEAIESGLSYVLPAGLPGSVGLTPGTEPSADYVVTITHNGTSVATATRDPVAHTWTFACAADVAVSSPDQIKFIGAGDADIADFGLTLKVRLS